MDGVSRSWKQRLEFLAAHAMIRGVLPRESVVLTLIDGCLRRYVSMSVMLWAHEKMRRVMCWSSSGVLISDWLEFSASIASFVLFFLSRLKIKFILSFSMAGQLMRE